MRLTEIENNITAYHGSPYLFDKFENRYGSGVGGNPLGHGIYFTGTGRRAMTYGQLATDDNFKRKFINRILFRNPKGTPYYLYTVSLLVEPQRLIDYSIPMEEQSQFVLSALGKIEKETGIDFSQAKEIDQSPYPSWKIVNHLSLHLKGKTLASNMLSKHGIQGIQLTRDNGETQYIIFDLQNIRIESTEEHKLS